MTDICKRSIRSFFQSARKHIQQAREYRNQGRERMVQMHVFVALACRHDANELRRTAR
jgi:hypothetical protein